MPFQDPNARKAYERSPKRLEARRARDKLRSTTPERLQWARDWAAKPSHKLYRKVHTKTKGRLKFALMQSRGAARRGGYTPCDPDTVKPEPADGLCDQCLKRPGGKRGLYMDHDHVTGRFRGWLCPRCNMGLAVFGDDVAGMEHALAYLKGRMPWS